MQRPQEWEVKQETDEGATHTRGDVCLLITNASAWVLTNHLRRSLSNGISAVRLSLRLLSASSLGQPLLLLHLPLFPQQSPGDINEAFSSHAKPRPAWGGRGLDDLRLSQQPRRDMTP